MQSVLKQSTSHPSPNKFLGRHFAYYLCTRGWYVTAIDSMVSPYSLSPMQWPKHLQCSPDALDFRVSDCRDYFKSPHSNQLWDLVVHLAVVGEDSTSGALCTGT
jgi:nucleoside-diphosphate-sugar epimerase